MAELTLQPEVRARWRARVLAGQGVYYLLTGLWPLVHFHSFASIVNLPTQPFQAHRFAVLVVVIGAFLLEHVRRGTTGPSPTLLGLAAAAAIALVEAIWLPRITGASGLWVDLGVQLALVAALTLLYPRETRERRTATRRR